METSGLGEITMDVFSKKKRSEIMSKIRSKNTKLDIDFRKMVWRRGMHYRLYSKNLPGKPDLVFASEKIAIFIDGCFWHKCSICFKKPSTNKKYWEWKIKYNVEKDKRINNELKKLGWKVIRFWEHDIKKNPEKCIIKIKNSFS